MHIVVAILLFSVLVIIHEFGHLIFAKRGGIVVEEFAVGMGPKLVGKTFRGTLYSIRLLPFGGFCRMLGEDDGSDAEGAFATKSVWTRVKVIFGGPLFNFMTAFVVMMIYIAMSGALTTTVSRVFEDTPAETAGIVEGDRIVRIGKYPITAYSEISIFTQIYGDETVDVVVRRDGQRVTMPITARYDEARDMYLLGVSPELLNNRNLFELFKQSVNELTFMMRLVYHSLSMLISGEVSAGEVSGPIGIVSAVSTSYTESLSVSVTNAIATMLFWLALLSVNLGVMNLLPIPALDGGRLVFLLIEGIRGKPMDREKEGIVHVIGFMILMALMVLVFYNDIIKLFRG